MTPDTKPEQASPVLFGKRAIAVIIGIVAILVALLAVGMMQNGQGVVVPPASCGEKVIAYVNNNMVTQGTTVTLGSVTENKGLYELKGQYQSQDIVLYATKDCTLLFTTMVNISAPTGGPVAPQETKTPVKSSRPTVDLYVMSFCPYGTQAETVMGPVVDLLASKADIRIRYITTISGSTVDSIDSLHGPSEAREDLQQICINRNYPEKFWSYIKTFNEQCYPSWQNATALASCRKNTLASLSMDSARIDSCAQGTEGITLLKADETAAGKDGASASPMLFINGVQYTGARTPEAYKQAICNSFETLPAECSTVLSSATASGSTGGCG